MNERMKEEKRILYEFFYTCFVQRDDKVDIALIDYDY